MNRRPGPTGLAVAITIVAVALPIARAGDEVAEFGALLGRLRRGEAVDPTALASAADAAAALGRPDAPRLAAFYSALSTDDRRRGWAAETRYRGTFARIRSADAAGLVGDPWIAEREEIEDELVALVRAEDDAPDPLPAGLALATLASIDVERAAASETDSEERLLWLASAEERAASALLHFERIGALKPQLEPLLVRGRIERARCRYAAAEATLETCIARAKLVGRDDVARTALEELLGVADDHGDLYLQHDLLRRVSALAPLAEFPPLVEASASHLIASQEPRAALALLERHPPAADADASTRARWDLLVGNALSRLGRTDEAGARYASLATSDNPESAALALARHALDDGRPDDAVAILAGAERSAFTEQGRAIAESSLGEAELARGRPERAVPHLERALALADDVDARRARELFGERGARTTIGEWLGLHTVALLAAARLELGAPLAALVALEETQARSLREGRASERRLRAIAGDAVPMLGAGPDDLVRWARRYELGLVSWVVAADFAVVVWLDGDGVAHGERLALGRDDVERARRRFVEALAARDDEHTRALADEILVGLFPAALQRRLVELPSAIGDAPRLLCLTHGGLGLVPIERLVLADGRILDDVATVVTLPGLPDARPSEREPIPPRWVVAGAPVGGDGPALPGARRELEHAARSLDGATALIGRAFERAAFERALAGPAAGGNLHVATHLVRVEDCSPRRFAPEGLLLSNGDVLCAQTIADLAPALHLALLSACETAGGRRVDADGLRGVARALLESGTRNLVLTLWPVADETAEAFARAFHEALRAGRSADRATRAARRALVADGCADSEWSAFRFVGRD